MKKIKNRKDSGIAKKDQKMKSKKAACHPDRDICARGLCKSCYNKWLMDNNPDYAERQRKNCRDWHEKYKDQKKKYDKKYTTKKDPSYRRILTLKNRYGITPDEYDFILKKQNGTCAICNSLPKDGKNLHVDHCHETGVIRGLLCFRCNFGLSYFNENEDNLQRAFLYVKNGDELSKELHEIILQREEEEKKESKEKEKIFVNAKTKGITDEEKEEMASLYDSGKRLCDIVKMFPQYSRSSVSRAAKRQTRSQKRV